jgi:hypothetical protein
MCNHPRQGWVVSEFFLSREGDCLVACPGLHTALIDGHLTAQDPYHRDETAAVVHLDPGPHTIRCAGRETRVAHRAWCPRNASVVIQKRRSIRIPPVIDGHLTAQDPYRRDETAAVIYLDPGPHTIRCGGRETSFPHRYWCPRNDLVLHTYHTMAAKYTAFIDGHVTAQDPYRRDETAAVVHLDPGPHTIRCGGRETRAPHRYWCPRNDLVLHTYHTMAAKYTAFQETTVT